MYLVDKLIYIFKKKVIYGGMGIIVMIFYVFWLIFRMLVVNEFSFCNWFFWVKVSVLKWFYIWCIINVLKRGGLFGDFD